MVNGGQLLWLIIMVDNGWSWLRVVVNHVFIHTHIYILDSTNQIDVLYISG
jgi:hypothetical protein